MIISVGIAFAVHAAMLKFGIGGWASARVAPRVSEVTIQLVTPPPRPKPVSPPKPKPVQKPKPIPKPAPKPAVKPVPATFPEPEPLPVEPDPPPELVSESSSDRIESESPLLASAVTESNPPPAIPADPIARMPAPPDPEPLTLSVPLYDQNPPPAYPRRARRRGYEGTVVLKAFVTETGSVTDVRLVESSGYRLLDQSALKTVRAWHFTPARRGDQPIAMWVTVPVKFELR